jgi:hypothetical protein
MPPKKKNIRRIVAKPPTRADEFKHLIGKSTKEQEIIDIINNEKMQIIYEEYMYVGKKIEKDTLILKVKRADNSIVDVYTQL